MFKKMDQDITKQYQSIINTLSIQILFLQDIVILGS